MIIEEKNILLKLSCIIMKSCYDQAILRKYKILGNIEKYEGWNKALFFITTLLEDIYNEKKELPTIDEADRMLDKTKKQGDTFLEFLDNKLEEQKQKQKELQD